MATSPMRTGAPAGVVLMTMFAISSGVRACPLTRLEHQLVIGFDQARRIDHVAAADGVQNVGNGDARPAPAWPGSGCTSNSGTCPPCTTTDDTPPWRFSRGLSS